MSSFAADRTADSANKTVSKCRCCDAKNVPLAERRAGALLDRFGVIASLVCLGHCLFLPVASVAVPLFHQSQQLARAAGQQLNESALVASEPVSSMPSVSEILSLCCSGVENHWFHLVLLLLVFPVGMVAWWQGFRAHRDDAVFWMGGIGLLMFVMSLVFGHQWHPSIDLMLTVGGSLSLILAHLWNRYLLRQLNLRNQEFSSDPRAANGRTVFRTLVAVPQRAN